MAPETHTLELSILEDLKAWARSPSPATALVPWLAPLQALMHEGLKHSPRLADLTRFLAECNLDFLPLNKRPHDLAQLLLGVLTHLSQGAVSSSEPDWHYLETCAADQNELNYLIQKLAQWREAKVQGQLEIFNYEANDNPLPDNFVPLKRAAQALCQAQPLGALQALFAKSTFEIGHHAFDISEISEPARQEDLFEQLIEDFPLEQLGGLSRLEPSTAAEFFAHNYVLEGHFCGVTPLQVVLGSHFQRKGAYISLSCQTALYALCEHSLEGPLYWMIQHQRLQRVPAQDIEQLKTAFEKAERPSHFFREQNYAPIYTAELQAVIKRSAAPRLTLKFLFDINNPMRYLGAINGDPQLVSHLISPRSDKQEQEHARLRQLLNTLAHALDAEIKRVPLAHRQPVDAQSLAECHTVVQTLLSRRSLIAQDVQPLNFLCARLAHQAQHTPFKRFINRVLNVLRYWLKRPPVYLFDRKFCQALKRQHNALQVQGEQPKGDALQHSSEPWPSRLTLAQLASS